MNEAPKKIWLADYQLRDVATWEWEGGTPYIRADIVDELVEALNAFDFWMQNDTSENNNLKLISDKARAALAKLEDV